MCVREHLHCNLSAISHLAVVNCPKPTLANFSLQIIGHTNDFSVGKPSICIKMFLKCKHEPHGLNTTLELYGGDENGLSSE